MRKATYWRTAGASEPVSYTWQFANAQGAVGSILSYDGVSTSAPVEAVTGQPNLASKSITAPSVSTVSPDALVVGLFSVAKNATVTAPTGMTERSEIASNNATTGAVTGETADYAPTQTGATGTKVATSSISGANIGQLVVLRPE